jgi:ATP-dependent DNA helicase RecG
MKNAIAGTGYAAKVGEGVSLLLALVQTEPGLRAPTLAARMQTSAKNIERWLKQLKDTQKIEFRGAPKTGGYHLKAHSKND